MFASMMRRSPMLGRTATTSPMLSAMGSTQVSMIRMASCAGFAKYQRTKPHLNVGTIGKFWSYMDTLVAFKPKTKRAAFS